MRGVRQSRMSRAFAVFCVALFAITSLASAGNWPQFRGPDGTGVSSEKNIPVTWSPGDYKWDVICADNAGIRCVLLTNGEGVPEWGRHVRFVIHELTELVAIIERENA